jgi:hypothetical protein
VKISLCHNWFGRARSKCFTLGLERRRFFFGPGASSVFLSVSVTALGEAFRKKIRLNTWLIRLGPYPGFVALTSAIFSSTAGQTFFVRNPYPLGFRPSSPPSRYCRAHSNTQFRDVPVSLATSSAGKLSSTNSFATFSFVSKGNGRVYLYPLLRKAFGPLSCFSAALIGNTPLGFLLKPIFQSVTLFQ